MYQSKRTPRVKQAEALERIAGRRAFALLMEMRTGKTKVIVDDWGALVANDKVLDLLVLAPGGAYLPWVDALTLDLPEGLLKLTKVFAWVSAKASTKARQRELKFFLEHRGPRVLIMNMEAVSSIERARRLCIEFLEATPGANYLVIDESVTIKNPDSSCGSFCVNQLAHRAAYRRILSGLVSPRSPLDLFHQYKFLDPRILGFDKFTTFRSRYAEVNNVCMLPNAVIKGKFKNLVGLDHIKTDKVLDYKVKCVDPEFNLDQPLSVKRKYLKAAIDGMPRSDMIEAIGRLGGYVQSIPIIGEYQNMEELHDKIAPYSFRVRLDECYDMPKSDYSFYDVEMTDEQARVYRDMKEHAVAELSDHNHVSANHVITQMLKLHQVLCGHVKDESNKVHILPERRTLAVIEILETFGGKAVIWASYDQDVRKIGLEIEKAFGKGSVARFWGGNRDLREAEEKAFREDPSCRFMVSTPDAGGKGRTWDVADLAIYYSSRNNLDHRVQSEDRIKAVGKTRPIAYIDLRVRGTVEDKIIDALRKKLDMSLIINGDNWREWLI